MILPECKKKNCFKNIGKRKFHTHCFFPSGRKRTKYQFGYKVNKKLSKTEKNCCNLLY